MTKSTSTLAGSGVVRSTCECEAPLFAEVDSNHRVCRGWTSSRDGEHELPAPAHAVANDGRSYGVIWLCPVCLRNTLRCFDGSRSVPN